MQLRHFLQFNDLAREEHEHLFARTRSIKDRFKRYERYWPLEDRTLAMIFEQQSTRTRLPFEAGKDAARRPPLRLCPRDPQLGRGRPVEAARALRTRRCDADLGRAHQRASRDR